MSVLPCFVTLCPLLCVTVSQFVMRGSDTDERASDRVMLHYVNSCTRREL